MHDAAFAAAGIDARYELAELEPEQVAAAVAAARGAGWLGLGVTAPYKRVVAGLCDEVEADATRDRCREQRHPDRTTAASWGFNTDAPGLPGRRGAGHGPVRSRTPRS